jgi:hypothetical protein
VKTYQIRSQNGKQKSYGFNCEWSPAIGKNGLTAQDMLPGYFRFISTTAHIYVTSDRHQATSGLSVQHRLVLGFSEQQHL